MRSIVFTAVSLSCVSAAFARMVVPLAPSSFPDAEVTEYRALAQTQDNFVGLNVSLQFGGTASNNVEVAIGCDADGDSVLSLDETDVVFGWDCGRCFVRNVSGDELFEEDAVGDVNSVRSLSWRCEVVRRRLKAFAAVSESGACFDSLSESCPSWLYDAGWNLMRLTVRGLGVREGCFAVQVVNQGVIIFIR